MEAIIESEFEIIPLEDLTEFPRFFRVDRLCLYSVEYNSSKSINEICQTCVNHLRPIKEVLNGSLLSFCGTIHQDRPDLLAKLLEHLRDELLPICALARGYKFEIYLCSDENAGTNVIDQILQMPQVDRSSNVKFELYYSSPSTLKSIQLPVKAISNWLHRTYDGIKIIGQTQTKRCLEIETFKITNATKMFDHIKKVLFFLHIVTNKLF